MACCFRQFSEQWLTRLGAHLVTHEKGGTPKGGAGTQPRVGGAFCRLPWVYQRSSSTPTGVASHFSQELARNPYRVNGFDRLTQSWTRSLRPILGSDIQPLRGIFRTVSHAPGRTQAHENLERGSLLPPLYRSTIWLQRRKQACAIQGASIFETEA